MLPPVRAQPVPPDKQLLEPGKVLATIEALQRRIAERFPGSGLEGVCASLLELGKHSRERIAWIATPIVGLRILAILLSALLVVGVAAAIAGLRTDEGPLTFVELVQGIESAVNDVVFIGIAIFFLWTLERRIRRTRALTAIHELRSLAHVIDMHQLTKDPGRILGRDGDTASSPARALSSFQLERYLDYCSEMLSLTGKVAVLYIQHFDDATVLASANEVEILTTGLARKVWQKLVILHVANRGAAT